jgi:arsenite-transporting ATPase
MIELAPNLWGQEIDLLSQMDQYWGTVQGYLNALFMWQGMDSLVAEETAVLPGMEELSSLMQITSLAESGRFDVIIIDAAPTGSTLQLLSFLTLRAGTSRKFSPSSARRFNCADDEAYDRPCRCPATISSTASKTISFGTHESSVE